MNLTTLPPEFDIFWRVHEDLAYVRIPTSLWREILLEDLDKPIIRGSIRQLVGKKAGLGVYEIRLKKKGRQH